MKKIKISEIEQDEEILAQVRESGATRSHQGVRGLQS